MCKVPHHHRRRATHRQPVFPDRRLARECSPPGDEVETHRPQFLADQLKDVALERFAILVDLLDTHLNPFQAPRLTLQMAQFK